MEVALKCSTTVGPTKQMVSDDGKIVGHNSGLFLVRQMIQRWPGLTIIGDERREGDGFRVARATDVDPFRTLVVSMDLIDTQKVVYQMRGTPKMVPKAVNFFWANVSDDDYRAPADRAALGLGAAYFPTYANSRKAMLELEGVIRATQAPHRGQRARLAYGTLGIDLPKIPHDRVENDRPVVLFPGIYVFTRKHPEMWLEILDHVDRTHDFVGRVRVSPRHAKHRMVPEIQKRSYVDYGPQMRQAEYYESLRTVDVALATSEDESYGLAYMEAMYAGAVGILPDLPWSHTLVPDGYPFLYGDKATAIAMTRYVLDDLPRARDLVEQAGFTREYVEREHDGSKFWDGFEAQALAWYPRLAEETA